MNRAGTRVEAVKVLSDRERRLMKGSFKNFVHALVAVLAGNLVYFLLMPRLPVRAQHVWFRLDLGLVVDFFFCLVIFGVIKTIAVDRKTSKLHKT